MSLCYTIEILKEWLHQSEDVVAPTVFRFGRRLNMSEVQEAAEIARTKFPKGGTPGFKYFCGICHRMIEDQEIRDRLR